GHNLFNVVGFDGVAPGAQLLGLKIANDARGGISVTGSIQHAMEYAARFAEQRNLPLVLNLSWGIGNEPGERAVLDSIVNAFDTGNEIKAGTSMSAPYVAGLAACLMSALAQEGRRPDGAEVSAALRAAAAGLPGASVLDQGAGLPQLERAYRWLLAGHQGSGYAVRASTGGGSAAFRREGLAGPGDTVETFQARHVTGLRVAQFSLKSDAPWLSAPAILPAGSHETEIPLTYSAAALGAPGVYVGTVTAWNPSDALAGPVFRLVNVVVVPYDLTDKPLYDERRTVGPAQVRRYFLRVAQPGATLVASVTLADSGQQTARAILYEPNGAP